MGRPNIHPGEILREEFLRRIGVTTENLATHINLPHGRVVEVVDGRGAVCPDMAIRLSRYFGTSDRFWLEAQMVYDLERARLGAHGIEREITPHPSALAS